MYLSSVRVQAFRGIGPATTLALQPGPGLTVVTGRNGSGKSSFADAAELALTGATTRWSGKDKNVALWRQGWRNLHVTGPTEIEVGLVVAGEEAPVTVRMSWPGNDLDQRAWTRQRHGDRREPTDAAWLPGTDVHRPFLSYDELGALSTAGPRSFTTPCTACSGCAISTSPATYSRRSAAPTTSARRTSRSGRRRC